MNPLTNIRHKYLSGLYLCAILLFAKFAAADDQVHRQQQACDENFEQCVKTGEWNFSISVGLGLRTNPLFQSDDIPLVILPEFSYYGENFFIDNLDLGYTLIDTPQHSLNLIATPSFDSVFFSRWDPGNLFVNLSSISGDSLATPAPGEDNFTQINPDELSKRKFSYLAGIEYSQDFKQSQLQISLLNDITNTHSGKEVRFAYAYYFSRSFSTTIGFTWKDKNLTDYYYGVEPDEIIDNRGAYQASASINPLIRFSYNSVPENHGNWRLSLELQKLDSQITHSPILNDEYVVTFYLGKRFNFE